MKKHYVSKEDEQLFEQKSLIASAEREFRFIITQKCNYDCFFCHKEGFCDKKDILLTPDDFNFIFSVGKKYFGHNNTTITGGEPLCNKDVLSICQSLFNSGAKITLVTNGYLLNEKIEIGKYIDRANISFHSTIKKKYESAVRRINSYEKVVDNICLFRKTYPDKSIRLNSTVINNLNSKKEDVLSLISFAKEIKGSIKYIELFPPNSKNFTPLEKIGDILIEEGFKLRCTQPTKIVFSDGETEVILSKILCAIQATNSCHCWKNNNIFVSQDGNIKPCMNKKDRFNVLKEIKNRDNIGIIDKINSSIDFLSNGCPLTLINKEA
ncbi:MAG: radical SAM protein [Candidatus Pacebacteria bacterium]|nr:radical SAM protein [Candidatus Paceibacterota bacterium]